MELTSYNLMNHYCTHAVGVSLKLQGATIPNNSLISVRDILYRTNDYRQSQDPTNNDSTLHDQALLCVTDLADCCRPPRIRRGEWYYPNGSVVQYDTDGQNKAFRRNRGANEVIADRKFYGSVRLFRRYTPPERGRFHCELPSAANPSVNQTLYVYICEFVLP